MLNGGEEVMEKSNQGWQVCDLYRQSAIEPLPGGDLDKGEGDIFCC